MVSGKPSNYSKSLGRLFWNSSSSNFKPNLTHSVYGWDVDENGMLEPNWREQNYIDYMKWQISTNGMSPSSVARSLNSQGTKGKRGGKWQGNAITRTIENTFHKERKKFVYPANWGSKPWHR